LPSSTSCSPLLVAGGAPSIRVHDALRRWLALPRLVRTTCSGGGSAPLTRAHGAPAHPVHAAPPTKARPVPSAGSSRGGVTCCARTAPPVAARPARVDGAASPGWSIRSTSGRSSWLVSGPVHWGQRRHLPRIRRPLHPSNSGRSSSCTT